MSNPIDTNSPPKRRLSLFSFGNKKNTGANAKPTAIDQEDPHSNVGAASDTDPAAENPQLMSPNSPLSLTDENLKNLNSINYLPPPSLQHNMHNSHNSPHNSQNNPHNPHNRSSTSSHSGAARVPSDTMSESSLIFERHVQDPFPATVQGPFEQNPDDPLTDHDQTPQPALISRKNSHFIAPHLTNENFIPLLIDSTLALIQSNTDLDEVDMIYSPRRSSVLNLSTAFCNSPQQHPRRPSVLASNLFTKSPTLERSASAVSTGPFSPQQQPQQQQAKSPPFLRERKSTISFLSYADMIQNEDQEQNISRRPSISQTLSSSFLASPNAAGSTGSAPFNKPRNDSLSSRTPLRQPLMFTHSPSLSRQTSLRNSFLNKLNTGHGSSAGTSAGTGTSAGNLNKFTLAPDSPTSELSDNDELMLKKSSSRNRTLSSTSSHHSQGLAFTAPPAAPVQSQSQPQSQSSQNIDDVLDSEQPHEIVVSSVADTLRQYKQDIRSS